MKTENKVETKQKIKILYISPRDMLKARSDPIHIMASCKWFRRSGADVELLAPYYKRPENIAEKDIYRVYGINEPEYFRITHLPTNLSDYSSPFSVRIKKLISYGWDAFKRFVLKKETMNYEKYIVYSKCYFSFLPYYYLSKVCMLKNVTFVFEVASFQGQSIEKNILNKFSYIIAINPFLKSDLVQIANIKETHILVPPNGVDDSFSEFLDITKEEARSVIGFPMKDILAVYSGKIVIDKKSEIALILEAAKCLPDVKFVFTGGKDKDIDYYKKQCESCGINNAKFTGFFPSQGDTFVYLRAADILLSFYPKNIPTLKYMGPNKIIQYARSRRVIISARYPAIEVVLGKDGAIYVEPEDVAGLVNSIEKVKKGEINTEKIANNAFNRIKSHSYENRAQSILNFIDSKNQ